MVQTSSRLKRTRTSNASGIITLPPSATSAANTSAAVDASAVNANDNAANATATATATAKRYSATLPPTITNISKCTPSIVFGNHLTIEIQELDFTSRPRMYKGKEIQLTSKTPYNIDDNTRHLVITTAIMMGYWTDSSNIERDRITETTMWHVYYLKGYKKPSTRA
ncbi:predicted protein [Chaetoceros tenuissimus]|uniref:Uncharacterized protein n=1 Tax=Chaetoceros tenuissimus TaxID=426638 RepID=A0AAD3CRC8_9STRA|nr:predicted protein [Chaetoceros tenuissimus]